MGEAGKYGLALASCSGEEKAAGALLPPGAPSNPCSMHTTVEPVKAPEQTCEHCPEPLMRAAEVGTHCTAVVVLQFWGNFCFVCLVCVC